MRPRGENIEYDKLRDRYDALAAELAAQRKEHADTFVRWRAYEAALREIATVEPGAECQVGCDQIARKALGLTAETKGEQDGS